jgi:Suppressor of fused protein (SUFU)
MSEDEAWREWFEGAWAQREEQVYPRLFGPVRPQIWPLSHEVFRGTFKQEAVDPRWLTYGVMVSEPNERRPSWLYVSSGLSNAWEDESPVPSGPSGLGMEFVLETTEEAEWPILRLHHLIAFQILIACGRYPGRTLIDMHDRIPLRAPISPSATELTWLVVAPSVGYDSPFQLSTGQVDLWSVVGISEAEAELASTKGPEKLLALLAKGGAYPVTDPVRGSLATAA